MNTEQVVRIGVEAYNAGDVIQISNLLHDNIHYCIHADEQTGPYRIDCQGKDAFWEAVEKIQLDWEINAYDLIDLIVSGNRAATRIKLELTSRRTNASRTSQLALFWTVEQGKVVELHEYHDTAAMTI